MVLNTLIDLAREDAEQASRALGQCQQQRAQAEQQLGLLRDYRQDYLEKLQSALQTGLAAQDCHNYQRFIATLDTAIAQQASVLAHAEQQLAAGRAHWQHSQRKLKSLQTLLARAQSAQALRATRTEQRASDEFAARRYHDATRDVTRLAA